MGLGGGKEELRWWRWSEWRGRGTMPDFDAGIGV